MPKRRRSGKSAGGPVGDPAGFLAPRALRLGHNFDDECDAVEGASPAYRALAALVGRPVFGEYEEEDADACGRRPGRSLTRARHRAGPFLWVNRTITSGRRWEPMPSVSRSRIALSFFARSWCKLGRGSGPGGSGAQDAALSLVRVHPSDRPGPRRRLQGRSMT